MINTHRQRRIGDLSDYGVWSYGGDTAPDTNTTITAYSIPQYGWWGGWTCGEWQRWHVELVSVFGHYDANNRFLAFWTDSGTYGSYCELNPTFVDYFQKQGIDLNSLINLVSDVTQNATQGVKTGSAILKYAIIAASIYGVYRAYRWVENKKVL